MLLATTRELRRASTGLDLLNRTVPAGGIDNGGREAMVLHPSDERRRVVRHRRGRRRLRVLENSVKDLSGGFCESCAQLRLVAVNVGEEEKGLLVHSQEARVVHGTDCVLRLGESRHQGGQFYTQRFRVGGGFDRKFDREVTLISAHRRSFKKGPVPSNPGFATRVGLDNQ